MSRDLKKLLNEYEDVRRLFAGEPMQYRKSTILPELTGEAQAACATINRLFFDDNDEAMRLFHDLIPEAGEGIDFRPPINLDYGIGLKIGDRTFINKDFLVVGGGYITIGEDCLIGPRCSIYTPNHAFAVKPRLEGWEHTSPVTIGNNVWLGGSVTILPGAVIGDNSIIGAGSVVSGTIPADFIAVGNPCRVVKSLPEE